MTKCIIKNCPCYDKDYEECLNTPRDVYKNCVDISDCPLKQIVEECREEIKPICQIPDGCCGMKNIYSDSKEFAEKLLSYLEIEEVK